MTGSTAPARATTATPHLTPTDLILVVRSEWTKLWSLRSTGWTLLATIAATVGFSTLAAWAVTTQPTERPPGPLDVTGVSLAGLGFGQLPIAVLGVLVISGEYSTGSIQPSLAAVPARGLLLGAKAVVITIVSFVTGLLASFPSFYVGMAFFDAHHLGVGIGAPHVLRAVIGGALLLAACALLGLAVGTLMRHTAGAITVSVALLFVIPIVLSAIPADIVRTINEYFLSSAGGQITSVLPQPHVLSPWRGYLVFVAEIGALLTVATVLMRRRDA